MEMEAYHGMPGVLGRALSWLRDSIGWVLARCLHPGDIPSLRSESPDDD